MADVRAPQPSFTTPEGVDTTPHLPLQNRIRLRERDIIERARRYFGHPVITVELTEDHYGDSLEETKLWWIDNWGNKKFRMFDLTAGIREIQMTDDVLEVIDVLFEAVRIPPLVFDRDFPFFAPFPLRAEGGIVFSYPTGLYSGIVQQLQWIEQLKRVFSAEPEWEFDKLTKILRIFPAFEVGEKRMVVEYISDALQVEELLGEALKTFFKYFLTECALRLGQIRSKYDSLPVAGGTASLNGAALLDWATDQQEKLTEWAHARNAPYRFLVG